jgi:DNA-binding HxlR family transcriptional regulator
MNLLKAPAEAPPPLQRERAASSVIRALDVLSDPWSFLILREAFFAVRRFEALRGNLMIARNILTERLGRLVAEGVLERRLYAERPPRYEYRLTEAGRDFYPAIIALMAWGDRWRPAPNGPPLRLFHADDGSAIDPVVVCSSCARPISPFDVVLEDGPGAGTEIDFTTPSTRRRGDDEAWLRGRPCSVARALHAIGDRWSFRILRQSFFGAKRFEAFQQSLGIARNILSERLARLVGEGILERHRYQERPERFEYSLSPAGLALYPSFLLLMAWGDRWRMGEAGPPLLIRHKPCGAIVQPRIVCARRGTDIVANAVVYRMNYRYPPADEPV